jgi:acetylglutamate kinase
VTTVQRDGEPMKRVVKLGGRAQSADALPSLVASAWNANRALCIVHGGGDEITTLQRAFGTEPRFAGGRRITTREDLDIIRMVLSGSVNKRLVSRFIAAGANAVGLSGEDAQLIGAEPLGIAEFGYAGMPARINTSVIETLWLAGYLPVVSPVGASLAEPGTALNVNGDDAAAAIAVALGADELLLVADVEGVLDADGSVIVQMDVEEARALIAAGVAKGGMAAKLEAAYAALAGGVRTVRIADLAALDDLARGTTVTLAGVTVGGR